MRALGDSIVDLIEVEVFNIGSENSVEELTQPTVCNPIARSQVWDLRPAGAPFRGQATTLSGWVSDCV